MLILEVGRDKNTINTVTPNPPLITHLISPGGFAPNLSP